MRDRRVRVREARRDIRAWQTRSGRRISCVQHAHRRTTSSATSAHYLLHEHTIRAMLCGASYAQQVHDDRTMGARRVFHGLVDRITSPRRSERGPMAGGGDNVDKQQRGREEAESGGEERGELSKQLGIPLAVGSQLVVISKHSLRTYQSEHGGGPADRAPDQGGRSKEVERREVGVVAWAGSAHGVGFVGGLVRFN
ncbi:Dynamin related protein 5A isoform 1 [Dorcoceras hygrometricum]|uniref:Dynamin related protein 5A isoform 1 n=1 Tax=Dorcoceras hygrometricum TaxID=472368 RepID=A0A2Z7D1G5_9LAMI|nr:Dynamin related protein 5A isoform 1 [Dorcoceras hygrometricum]